MGKEAPRLGMLRPAGLEAPKLLTQDGPIPESERENPEAVALLPSPSRGGSGAQLPVPGDTG